MPCPISTRIKIFIKQSTIHWSIDNSNKQRYRYSRKKIKVHFQQHRFSALTHVKLKRMLRGTFTLFIFCQSKLIITNMMLPPRLPPQHIKRTANSDYLDLILWFFSTIFFRYQSDISITWQSRRSKNDGEKGWKKWSRQIYLCRKSTHARIEDHIRQESLVGRASFS